jgi:hypothetical protein
VFLIAANAATFHHHCLLFVVVIIDHHLADGIVAIDAQRCQLRAHFLKFGVGVFEVEIVLEFYPRLLASRFQVSNQMPSSASPSSPASTVAHHAAADSASVSSSFISTPEKIQQGFGGID